MTKDYLKFRNAIKKDTNLSLEESYMLELLFDYYNTSCGYAYPSYEILMSDLKTKRKAKVSKLLKALVRKGYILIKKCGKKNTYKLLRYLFLNQPVDSNGKPPVDGQIHFTELTEEESKVIELGFTQKQAKSLLQVAKTKVDKVVNAFAYATNKGADNLYAYTLWAIKNGIKIVENKVKTKSFQFVENCSSRNYSENDWDLIEKRLLGWE